MSVTKSLTPLVLARHEAGGREPYGWQKCLINCSKCTCQHSSYYLSVILYFFFILCKSQKKGLAAGRAIKHVEPNPTAWLHAGLATAGPGHQTPLQLIAHQVRPATSKRRPSGLPGKAKARSCLKNESL